MRRKDKEIVGIDEKLEIIAKCKVCRLGLSENNHPYIVPLNYGFSYDDGRLTLYFHCALEGKKVDIIRKNNNACFEIDCDTQLIDGEIPCCYGYEFKSVIGFGKVVFLDAVDEKIAGLNYLMKQQTGNDVKYDFNEDELSRVLVFKMSVDEFKGKQKVIRKDVS
ncbi:MAG: pyridoxamine 5'-phosphate oxidase family protein [Chitinispirillales bacterium]|jgi:nitroimidazol reductase NimA-like FMN-containing flavoprotein (pyridoxamine 5'-phosphate oxidase superfamily)|nr:pyridoxamine 5'-phosphate oxidase family protein [Chitinispirillales bacterium]